MTTAREVMTHEIEYAMAGDTIRDAARTMAERDVGALPICNENLQVDGVLTDRDITVQVVADGRDPDATRVSDITPRTEVVTIAADDSIDEVLATMKRYAVRRVPVVDRHSRVAVVGIVSQADLARRLPETQTGELVEAISRAPSNTAS